LPFSRFLCFRVNFVQSFISLTGGQSVSIMLLWKSSSCIDSYILVHFWYINKYDDDDDNDDDDNANNT